MRDEYRIRIDGVLPGTNDLISKNRQGWRAGAASKRNHTLYCKIFFSRALKSKKIKPITAQVDIDIVFYEEHGRRDPDNILGGGLKHILDGAVESGFLPNDNQRYIGKITSEIRIDRKDPHIEIVFREEKDGS